MTKVFAGSLCAHVLSSEKRFPSGHSCQYYIPLNFLTKIVFIIFKIRCILLQVFQITKGIGWIPTTASRETAYLHLNKRIPNELKFDLNCLFVTHGKLCRSCKQQDNKTMDNSSALCPLVNYTYVNRQEVRLSDSNSNIFFCYQRPFLYFFLFIF